MAESQHLARIAIVGMAGRFPGAADVDAFWRDIRDGVDRITRFDAAELRAAGVPDELLRDPAYVPARGVLADADHFDAARFGMSAREAETLDPQQRVFLECALAALEDAGRADRDPRQIVGVFAGAGASEYAGSPAAARAAGDYQLAIGGEKDFLATRVAHRLDLRGPCMTVQSACSTALVAVCVACQSLLAYQCDVALAGGVAIGLPLGVGYLYRPGMVLSPDGTCRPFAADAAGTVPGDGVGVVALRRLEDALADGDEVLAVLCGFGLTNDGAARQSFAAPGIDGQAAAIAQALAMAEFEPATITYVETHGTGTALGDPVEVAALAQAFRGDPRRGACALGSVKANIGHLDAAAGIASLIKVVQMLRHRELPPSRHVARVNPRLELEATPFCIHTTRRPWDPPGPRRAGVSSFGVGGTNAHVVLEEAPPPVSSYARPGPQLLPLSAATKPALAALEAALAQHLTQHPDQALADVAYTLQAGRRAQRHRRAVVCDDHAAAIAALASEAAIDADEPAEVVFLFPGHGAGYPDMGRELCDAFPSFCADLDEGLELLRARTGIELRPALFPAAGEEDSARVQLTHATLGQPAIFLVEWALGRLLQACGVRPCALLGHSLGEFAAACLAGVLSLADALVLVAERGALIAGTSAGTMLAVGLTPAELAPLLGDDLELAAINGPAQCVVAGRPAAASALAVRLADRGVACRSLAVPYAFHSWAMDPIVAPFIAAAGRVSLHAPQLPLISSAHADLLGEQATDPAYWGHHLRAPVRFEAALRRVAGPSRVLLEVGPGDTLTTLVRRHPDLAFADALATLRRAGEPRVTTPFLRALGRLWERGVPVTLAPVRSGPQRRVRLPTYPFDRSRYWRDVTPSTRPPDPVHRPTATRPHDLGDYFHRPVWRAAPLSASSIPVGQHLIFADTAGLALALRSVLPAGCTTLVHAGDRFARTGPADYTLRPTEPADYAALLDALAADGRRPDHILHLWGVDADERPIAAALDRGLLAVLRLVRALHRESTARPLRLLVVTCGATAAAGTPVDRPAQAMTLVLPRVLPEEYPHVRCGTVDLARADVTPPALHQLAAELSHELGALASTEPAPIARRGVQRFALGHEPQRVDAPSTPAMRRHGAYLITGGLGGIGLVLARHLAGPGVRLALLGRTGLPPRALWPEILASDPSPAPDGLAARILAVEDLERAGAEVLIVTADVACPAAMRRAMATIRARFGALDGVVHAAGVAAGGIIQRQTDAEVHAALAPKVHGALLLAELTAGDPLTCFVLCSSLTAIGGGFGQLAYAAANCFLDAFALDLRRRGVPAVAIAWDGWSEVGMAARGARGPGHSHEPHPLLGASVLRTASFELHRRRLDPEHDWVLAEHRLHRRPTLPGTAFLELAWAAAATRIGAGSILLRDVILLAPLAADEAIELWTVTRRTTDGWVIELHGPAQMHMHCTATALDRAPRTIALDRLRDGCDPRDPADLLRERRHIDLGAHWRCTQRLWTGPQHAVVELLADDDVHPLHPAALDMAAGCASHLAAAELLPHSYAAVRVHGPLRGRLLASARLVARGPRALRFDVGVYDEQGEVLLEIDDYCLTVIRPANRAEERP